jgi:hypothetical protein
LSRGGTAVPLDSTVSQKIAKTFSKPSLITKCNDENKFENLNMIDAQNKRIERKYEIISGLPLAEGS